MLTKKHKNLALNTKFNLLIFSFVNLIYLIYMNGFLPQSVYYLTLVGYCLISLITILLLKKNSNLQRMPFFRELLSIAIICISFAFISFFWQIINKKIEFYYISQLLYILLPAIVVFCILNIDEYNIDIFLYILFIRFIIQFFLETGSNFTIDNILSIRWNDSNSSLMENSLAHSFFLIGAIFIYKRKNILGLIATFLCLLSFKRVAFIYCIISWFFIPFLRKKDNASKYFMIFIFLSMILVPFGLEWLYSENGNVFFNSIGLDINIFTSSRYFLVNEIKTVFSSGFNGFGTIANYFATKNEYYAQIVSIHCDILVIFFEVGIIGYIIYSYFILKITKRNPVLIFIFSYMFLELAFTHFTHGINEWILFYLLCGSVVNLKKNEVANEKRVYKFS